MLFKALLSLAQSNALTSSTSDQLAQSALDGTSTVSPSQFHRYRAAATSRRHVNPPRHSSSAIICHGLSMLKLCLHFSLDKIVKSFQSSTPDPTTHADNSLNQHHAPSSEKFDFAPVAELAVYAAIRSLKLPANSSTSNMSLRLLKLSMSGIAASFTSIS